MEVAQQRPQERVDIQAPQKLALKVAVIPAFNAVHTIAEAIALCRMHVDQVLVYDDGSTDNTTLVAEACGAAVYNSVKNRGKGYSLMQLFAYARSLDPEILITLDSDMQHDPANIPDLTRPIEEGRADVVVGCRQNQTRFRALGNKILDFLAGGQESQSGFRAYSRRAFADIKVKELGYGVDSQILMDLPQELRVEEVPVSLRYDRFSHASSPIIHFLQVAAFLVNRRIERAFERVKQLKHFRWYEDEPEA